MIGSDEVFARLRQRGERLTIQRRLVVEILCQSGSHLTINDIQARLHEQGQDLTDPTVYRILQWLKDQELVSQTDLGGSGIVYQIIDEHRHHHLVCLNCHRIIDLDDSIMDDLRERLRTEYNFEPRIDHMAVFGLCEDCHP